MDFFTNLRRVWVDVSLFLYFAILCESCLAYLDQFVISNRSMHQHVQYRFVLLGER